MDSDIFGKNNCNANLDPFDKFGDDADWLKLCAEWHVVRAEYHAETARDALATCWWEGTSSPSPSRHERHPLDRMKEIEEELRIWVPCSAMGVEHVSGDLHQHSGRGKKDPQEIIGQGPVLEYLNRIRTLLAHDPKLELKSPPHERLRVQLEVEHGPRIF